MVFLHLMSRVVVVVVVVVEVVVVVVVIAEVVAKHKLEYHYIT